MLNYIGSGFVDFDVVMLSFSFLHDLLSPTKAVKIINDIVFDISSNPMTSTHI